MSNSRPPLGQSMTLRIEEVSGQMARPGQRAARDWTEIRRQLLEGGRGRGAAVPMIPAAAWRDWVAPTGRAAAGLAGRYVAQALLAAVAVH